MTTSARLLHDAKHPPQPPLLNHTQYPQIMAQWYPQQFSQESHMRTRLWPATGQPYTSESGPTSNNMAFQQNRAWDGASMFDPGFMLPGNLGVNPQILSDSYNSITAYFNHGMACPGTAALELDNTGSAQCGQASSWYPRPCTEILGSSKVDKLHPEADDPYSPKSFVSETQCSEVLPFTPESIADVCSEYANNGYQSAHAYMGINTASPNSGIVKIEECDTFTELTQFETNSGYATDGLSATRDDASSQYSLEYGCSQESSPELSPLYTESGSHNMTAMPSQQPDAPMGNLPMNCLLSSYETHHGNNALNEPPMWDSKRASLPAQRSSHEREHMQEIASSQAKRKADDRILLEGKRNGLTYKEIRKKMHTKCAESTLRGRYRSLTKARRDRVRKPVWHDRDIELLNLFVRQDLDQIDSSLYHQTMSHDQRLAKVQWKRIADLIFGNGGSYHFGNSTCKRKWLELNPGS